MDDIVYAVGALCLIYLMTIIGAAGVFVLSKCKEYSVLNGFSGGIMLAACFWSLLLPASQAARAGNQSVWLVLSAGMVGGIAVIVLPEALFGDGGGELRVFKAITLHNAPEGLAVGVAFAAGGVSIAEAFAVALAIGVQNLPEGLATALPFVEKKGRKKAFLYGVASGAVEPVFGMLGLLLIKYGKAFSPTALSVSAGAMLYVCLRELLPIVGDKRAARVAFFIGFLLMTVLDTSLG